MKKTKSVFCAMALSTVLVGNVFAGDFTGTSVFSFFDAAVNAVVSVFRSADPCEGRICTNCKPGSGGSDSNGNCRPTEN